MEELNMPADNNREKLPEKEEEIIDSFFDSCDSWQCRKCGMSSLGRTYHYCSAGITRRVCEYCKYYSEGKCRK